MKKLLCLFSILFLSLGVVGCGKKVETKNIEGSLEEIMVKLYAGIKEEEMPMMVENTPLTEENFQYYAFTNAKYKEAIASESMTGSVAHSVVLIRLEDSKDAETVVKEIKEKADPRKWICVEAEKLYVLNKGDLVVLIMSNELADPIKANFENLK
jgi:hypothetical protein